MDDARSRVAAQGGTLGEQLVAAGAVTDDALTDFYRQRLLVPQVNPNSLARLSPKVVSSIPTELAIELRAIPVSLDGENNLTVAMSDPSDRHAVDEISFFTGAYVVRAVATQMQIAWCLAHYYGHVTALGSQLIQPAVAAAATPVPVPGLAAEAPLPRTKGLTGKVNAARHRAIAPVTGPINIVRPRGDTLDQALDHTESPLPVSWSTPADAVPEVTDDAATEPTDAIPEAVAEKPRTRSVSGEIRVPVRVRAASVKPAMPDPHGDGEDDDEPTISIEEGSVESGPKMMPVRRRVKSNPPELKERAGEVSAGASRPERAVDDAPRIIIADDALAPAVVVDVIDQLARGTSPTVGDVIDELVLEPSGGAVLDALLLAEEASDGIVVAPVADEHSEPVLLERKRPTGSVTPPPMPADAEPEAEDDGEVLILEARKTPTPPPPTRAHRRSGRRTQLGIGLVGVPSRPTPPAVTVPPPQRIDYDPVDDGWGPPGTTIPPPLLGALPGSDDEDDLEPAADMIPVANVDTAPLIVAPPSPPEPARGAPTPDAVRPNLVLALEQATSRAIQLIHALERAADRDEVITLMIGHLAEAHMRAGFFAMRSTGATKVSELAVWKLQPAPAAPPWATLRLDRPSTLQDVVDTRLPYRGPVHDDASRSFLQSVLGVCPPEILLVPVSVRDRVVGVLFGEHRMRHTFDDQLALAARAAGMALERILKAKRG